MAVKYPEPLAKLIEALESLPGVGARTAERLAFHILKQPQGYADSLGAAIKAARSGVRHCSRCYNVTQADLCSICQDKSRDQTTVCIVESPRELMSMEASGAFKGVYHCLLGRLAPIEGVSESDLTIAPLVARCKDAGKTPKISEVILATNPDLGGDATALAVARALAPSGVKISRLARGVPAGYQLDLLAGSVIEEAISGRQPVALSKGAAPWA